MGVLADYLKSEAEQIRTEAAKRKERLEEWTAVVERLYQRLESWLAAADNGLGVLVTRRGTTNELFGEARVGNYDTPVLWVLLGGVPGGGRAVIVPKARFVAASIRPPGETPRRADGMVEIRGGGGVGAEYYLFRLAGETVGDDRWFIRSVDLWNSDPEYGNVEELTRDRFEAAVLRVVQ